MDEIVPRDKLFISFSGGRTSAYMTQRLLKEYRGKKEIVVLFANTGQEDEQTLRFVERCNKEYNFEVVYLEAVVHSEKGKGTTHRRVDFLTASRDGRPFEDVINKFGIPNKNYPHCTRELKQRPMYSYIRSLGWQKGEFNVAVGIRYDEADRISNTAQKEGIVYPLVKWRIKEPDIMAHWSRQATDLYLPRHKGNCVTCWKKSDRKLLTIAKSEPRAFEFFDYCESEYGFNGPGNHDGPRHFFRGNRSTKDILSQATRPFIPYVDGMEVFDPELDVGGGCGDSCEVFTDEFVSDLFSMKRVESENVG